MIEDLELLEDFIEECEENFEVLNSGFLELEQSPEDNEVINKVFRSAHTIKGGCRLIGLPHMEKLTHAVEDLLDKARSEQLKLNTSRISVLLKAVDHIKAITEEIVKNGDEPKEDREDLLEDIRNAGQDGFGDQENPPVEQVSNEDDWSECADQEQWSEGEEKAEIKEEQEKVNKVESKPSPESNSIESKKTPSGNKPKEVHKKDSIKIDVHRLDMLMNLVGELVLNRNRLLQEARDYEDQALNAAVNAVSVITSELQEEIMQTRMQPIDNIFSRFHRLVRDLGLELGKKIQLEIIGEDTELDRTLIESIKDPLTHIVRNSLDHGIEPPEERLKAGKSESGVITIKSYQDGGHVVVEISDDGRGLQVDRILEKAVSKELMTQEDANRMLPEEVFELIFHPGFSTAEQITEVSGRGVGMDVVRRNIKELGGEVRIESEPGQGSRFIIHIPLTLAIIPAILVRVRDIVFAIPQVNLQELILLDEDHFIEEIEGTEVFRLRGNLIPVLRLRKEMDIQDEGALNSFIVILQVADMKFGLVVDQIEDSEEIVVKPLTQHFSIIKCFAGATIRGNGDIILILDIPGLASRASLNAEENRSRNAQMIARAKTSNTAVVFKVSDEEIFGVLMQKVLRLEVIHLKDVEFTSNKEVIQYRGGILPLIRLSHCMNVEEQFDNQRAGLIVFEVYGKEVGMIVREIVDTCALEGDLDTDVVEHPCVFGTMELKGDLVLLLDMDQVFNALFSNWKHPSRSLNQAKDIEGSKVLHVDDSPFYLKVVRKYLIDENVEIVSCLNAEDALEQLRLSKFDMVLVDLEMPDIDGIQFMSLVKKEFSNPPVMVALTALIQKREHEKAIAAGAIRCLVKLEKQKLLRNIHELLFEKEAIEV